MSKQITVDNILVSKFLRAKKVGFKTGSFCPFISFASF